MTRFDKLYAQTHPKVEETENHTVTDSAVEDFATDVDVENEAGDDTLQEGEEVDGTVLTDGE